MEDKNVRSSEIDRLLDGDISDDSLASEEELSDLFGDDSDNDPLYRPEIDQLSDSDLEFDQSRPSNSGNNLSRPRPTSFSQNPTGPTRNRHVLSSTSGFDSEAEDNDIWLSINGNNSNSQHFTHDFSYDETPGPKHCPPIESKPIDYFNLFFTEAL